MYVGSYTDGVGLDNGGWRLDARFHTTELIASPSCNVLFLGGGDEQGFLRRIYQDTVKHLMADGSYQIMNGKPNPATACGRPHCVDHKGHLFFTGGGGSENGILHQRMTFENTDTTTVWDSLSGSVKTENSIVGIVDDNLLYAFPNPFNPTTVFHYNLKKYWEVNKVAKLVIYNCNGEIVRDFTLDSPEKDIVWMADNNIGQRVAAGNYFAILHMDNQRFAKKVIFTK